jgi:predicted small lipoprotein YifL
VRRLFLAPLVAVLAAALAACGYQPEIEPPGAATGGPSAPPPVATTGPVSTAPTFTTDGCPVGDPAFCEQAAFLANALVLSDADAVFDLSRRVSMDCADLDLDVFPQCEDQGTLKGYVVGDHQGHLFVDEPADYRRTLRFFVEAVDDEYSDEFGGAQLQILGVSTCGKGADTTYHLVYLVGLGDPTSTLPADRFLGTYELTEEDRTWAVGATYVGLYTDWQLVLDDPLTQIACGDVQPWVGAAPNLNPPQSESQPTPIPATGST